MSKYIFIKDHFQHGLVSNFILRLMDFVSNYSDNVKIPSIYFNITTYENFISSLKIELELMSMPTTIQKNPYYLLLVTVLKTKVNIRQY